MAAYFIDPKQLAQIANRLLARGISADDHQLSIHIRDMLATVLDSDTLSSRADLEDISLPDLEGPDQQQDIIANNVRALSAIYFSNQLEDLKFFAVADKVLEQFIQGMLPISRGVAGEQLYVYYRGRDQRMTEVERRSLYARSFGAAQGAVDEPMPNAEFADLWIRFLSAVSVFNREAGITGTPPTITEPQVFKNAKDLAVNLSLHGYGFAHFGAVELQSTIKDLLGMLGMADVLAAYGVNDVWQLVERVSQLFLGGSVNGVRQRTMAQSGARIMQWIADNQPSLAQSMAGKDLFDAAGNLDAAALSDAVDRWLAVTGTQDATMTSYSQPIAVRTQPTIPNLTGANDMLKEAMAKIGNLGANGAGSIQVPKA